MTAPNTGTHLRNIKFAITFDVEKNHNQIMHRLLPIIITCEILISAVSCTTRHNNDQAEQQAMQPTTANDTVSLLSRQGKQRLLHNGTSDTIYEVVTQVFAARMEGDSIVKAGKPDYEREFSAFPNEDTCVYDTLGRVDMVCGIADGIRYKYLYDYDNRQLSDERYYQNGELFYDRKFIYNRGQRINTIEELYIAGSKTINEYPIDTSKIKFKNGNRIEFGDTPGDYTITDPRGNVIKESSYSEMDDYSSVIEYTYNDRGWRISINCEGEYLYTYDYTNIDAHGNWLKAVIRCNGNPYGIVERTITYY